MFNPLSMNAPYGELQFIQNLAPYDCNVGVDELLDLSREIQQSGNYFWQGVAIPASANTTVGALQTINGSVSIPDGSYVTAINFFSDSAVNPEGYKIKIYDEGTKASIFYGEYAKTVLVASSMQLQLGQGAIPAPSDPGMNDDRPFGLGYLMSPFIITKPGKLGWEIVNLSTVNAVIQVMLCVAVPANKRTASQMVVKKGY